MSDDDLPPLYPFPDDELLWWRDIDGFDPKSDSYFALAKLPEDDTRVFNGVEHTNPYRLVIRTPLRGSFAMFVNQGDLASLLAIALAGLADDESGMYGPKDEAAFSFFASYWERMSGVGVDVVEGDDE